MVQPSGTKSWSLQVDELITEALERVGGKFTSAEEVDSCMRSLNLVLKDLMNRGKPLFTIEQKVLNLTSSVADYTLSAGTVNILGPVIRVSGRDLAMNRLSFLDYQNIATKETTGQPTQYTTVQNLNNITLKVWPVPVSGTAYQISYYACEDPDDITQMYQGVDIHRRYLPCVTAGLAFYMAQKMPNFDLNKLAFLKNEWNEQLRLAFEEDRELTSFVIKPASLYQGYGYG